MKVTSSLLLIACAMVVQAQAGEPRIPAIHSTDLFHPHGDPDDHYDLATAFAIDELDLKAVILDLGEQQATRSGKRAVDQMNHIAGRNVPCAIGLSRKFRTPTDTGRDEPAQFQQGVELLLSVLRQSKQKVVITATGSCRDVAAAFNREPELLKSKVRAVYINIGRGPGQSQQECNVNYDPLAYQRMFEADLPLYWCPCFGADGYQTLYRCDQSTVVGACTPPVQNFFVYCLTRSQADPIEFLAGGPPSLPTGGRSMWCTAPMFHAAGRKIYKRGENDYVALRPDAAAKAGLADREVDVFRFVPMRVTIDRQSRAEPEQPAKPKPGELSAAFQGREVDRVGTGDLKPDGKLDCQVAVLGVAPERELKNIIITGPNEGRWEHVETGRWWRVAPQRNGRRLDVYFQFWAAGEHQVELVYHDGSSQSATFHVPDFGTPGLRVELEPAEPSGFVFRSVHPEYQQILASCLKNLLATLGR